MHEKSTEMDSNMPDPPEQHPLIDPYGPWMLVENRRHRPMKPPGHFNKFVPHSIATSSRYNLIFIEPNYVAGTSKAADATPISDVQQNLSISALNQDNVAPLPGNTIGLDPTHVPAPISSSGTPKSKAKTQVTSSKSSSLILKPRDSNVMPKRSVSGIASTVVNHGKQQNGPPRTTNTQPDGQHITQKQQGANTIARDRPANNAAAQSDDRTIVLH
ncbi:hypothetical protein V6N13_074169 [Hibiscus sabdariffa]|uniref:Uncharacterized protein n=1 Tax=Hibiscus sabdariffa TaxID=183260 RepID=A0ABR2U8G1_9ROSI